MVLRVTEVTPLPGYRLRVRFNDGVTREVDLSGELWGEMFEPLRDPDFFGQVHVDRESRTVVWPNGLDLDPEVLHGDLELGGRTGRRIPRAGTSHRTSLRSSARSTGAT